MTSLINQLLPRFQAQRLAGLDLGPGNFYPSYAGGSILNLPATICRLLGVPPLGAQALIPEILDPILQLNGQRPARRVIFVLMDALALHRFQRWLDEGRLPVWSRLAEQGVLAPLTSISPSTTTAALNSLWTGRSPAEHGVAGYELWLKEYGMVANMISQAPMAYGSRNPLAGLENAGYQPESYLPMPTLGEHLSAHGIQAYAFQHHSIAHSSLSRMFIKEAQVRSFSTPSELWINLRSFVENQPGERQYIWVYWGEVDHFSHFYGPDDERAEAEFEAFSQAMESLFLNRLGAASQGGTLLLLTADHGAITTPKDERYELRKHPELMRRLPINPTGENRMAYFYIRPGEMDWVRAYIEKTWPGEFSLTLPAEAVQGGLLGPGSPHPRLHDRLGDLIALARGPAYFWWADKDNTLLGRHGGLTPEEMLVPLLAAQL